MSYPKLEGGEGVKGGMERFIQQNFPLFYPPPSAEAIREVVKSMGLTEVEEQVAKVIRLHESLRQRWEVLRVFKVNSWGI